MNDVFLLLILAHILGDFMLQPLSWIEQRRAKKWKAPAIYFHGFIHITLALLALLITGYDSYWYTALIIGGTHILIDPIKALTNKKRLLFFVDQATHILVICLSIGIIFGFQMPEFSVESFNWKVIIAFVFVTRPSSILITQLLPSDWGPQNNPDTLPTANNQNGLKNAGEYIGILERLLILGFIFTNNWSGIGFLLAAKSVFRFSDLQKSEHRKQTEYIMIGTLLSFSIAILIGWWASF